MALNTSRKLKNALFDMYGSNLVWPMGMTVGTGVLIILPGVTNLAIVFAIPAMVQGKGVDTQLGWLPGHDGMAANAVQAKLASMNNRLTMAFGTVDSSPVLNRWLVTGLALQASVPTFKGKNILMIEGHHRIAPVMAVVATVAIEGCMIGHEDRIGRSMAGLAVNPIRAIARPTMTVFAENRAIIVITAVPG